MLINEVIYFSHELDMLEAHIHEASKYANRIIVKESPTYFTGKPKPLIASENWDRFKKYPKAELMVIPEGHLIQKDTSGHDGFDLYKKNHHLTRSYDYDSIREDCDYVFSMDCDEIIDSKKIELLWEKYLSSKKFEFLEILHFLNMRAVDNFADVRGFYKIHRADLGWTFHFKGRPRTITDEVFAWHFHNCFITPEDLRTKNIGHAFAIGYNSVDEVEGVKRFEDIINGKKVTFGPTDQDERSYKRAKMCDADLPEFIVENKELFPWAFR